MPDKSIDNSKKQLTRREFIEIAAIGSGSAFLHSSIFASGQPNTTRLDGYMKKYITSPVINSHVHVLPEIGYDLSKLFTEMDETGQDIAIFQLMDKVPDSSKTIIDYLEQGRSYCDEFPGRLIPFVGIHPGNPDALQLVDTAINKYKVAGFGEMIFSLWANRGIGSAYGLSKEITPTDKTYCWPFYQKLQDSGALALFDATQVDGGDGICYSSADYFQKIAEAFPGLNFVIAGACITSDYTGENTEKCIELCQTYDNVYLDIHDWQVVEDKTGRFDAHGFKDKGGIHYLYSFLRRLFDHPKSRSKILFGSDWPLANLTVGMNELQWATLIMESFKANGYSFTSEEWKLFFYSNALGFLKKSRYFDEKTYHLS